MDVCYHLVTDSFFWGGRVVDFVKKLKFSSNRKVDKVLRRCLSGVEKAASNEDLLREIEALFVYPTPVSYTVEIDQKLGKALYLFILFFTGFILFLLYSGLIFSLLSKLEFPYTGMYVLAVTGCLAYATIKPIRHFFELEVVDVKSLSRLVSLKHGIFTAGLVENQRKQGEALGRERSVKDNGEGILVGLDISARGISKSEKRELNYDYFCAERQVKTLNDSGSISVRIYRRYGIVLDFGYIQNVHISSPTFQNLFLERPESQSVSAKFDEFFSIETSSRAANSLFQNPKLQQEMLHFRKSFLNLEMNFDEEGRLCISFDSDNLLTAPTDSCLETPRRFSSELKCKRVSYKLQELLNFAHILADYSAPTSLNRKGQA